MNRVVGALALLREREPGEAEPVFVAWLLLDGKGNVLMERCPKKRALFGGEWFVPDRDGRAVVSGSPGSRDRELSPGSSGSR